MTLTFAPRRALSAAGLALLLGAASLTSHAVASPRAHAAATCDVSKDGRKLGATYVTSLKVSGVSCSKGKRVVKSFNSCRHAHGGADGTCSSRVQGFRCRERRSGIATQYDAKVTCKSGSRSVAFRYTQFT